MKVSMRWLSDYVDIDLEPKDLAHRLTMSGNEVEGVIDTGANWAGIRVGEIIRLERHPNADRLWLATVNLGDRTETVVTGAPNLEAGVKAPYAPVGTTVINGHTGEPLTIQPAKLRGIVSAGMVLSEKELGISDDHSGILILPPEAPVGAPLSEYLGDAILDIAVTPNRPDCMSILGIAREVAVLTGKQTREPVLDYRTSGSPADEAVSVSIESPELCRRYTATLIRNVKVGPSPEWLQKRLATAGIRSINNVVDITNYVMLELGQPLHAFDYDRLHGRRIVVRRARPGEAMTTLDGVERRLTEDTLVIADADRPVAIAGVMGGFDTEVSEATTNVLIESANFDNISIRRTSSRLRLRSEASARFDKGISPEITASAAKRATQLIGALAGGEPAPGIVDEYPRRLIREPMLLTLAEVERLLGVALPLEQIADVFRALRFEVVPIHDADQPNVGPAVQAGDANALLLTAPPDRMDINQTEDLIEEIARIIGYDELPTAMLNGEIPAEIVDPERKLAEQVRDLLVGAGMQEVVTYSLVSAAALLKVGGQKALEAPPPIHLANPMTAEQEYLRTTLRPSMLATLAANARHWDEGMRLFEVGRVYLPRDGDLPEERRIAIGGLAGRRWPRSWAEPTAPVDFYDAKAVIETVLERLGLEAAYEPIEDPNLHPGKSAAIVVEGRRVGVVGEVHPALVETFDLEVVSPVQLFEIDLPELLAAGPRQRRYQPIPRYPSVERDLAVVVDLTVASATIQAIMLREPLVRTATLFDVYTGAPLPAGKKSLAYSLRFQSLERTLTDADVDTVQDRIVEQLQAEVGATLRT